MTDLDNICASSKHVGGGVIIVVRQDWMTDSEDLWVMTINHQKVLIP